MVNEGCRLYNVTMQHTHTHVRVHTIAFSLCNIIMYAEQWQPMMMTKKKKKGSHIHTRISPNIE